MVVDVNGSVPFLKLTEELGAKPDDINNYNRHEGTVKGSVTKGIIKELRLFVCRSSLNQP